MARNNNGNEHMAKAIVLAAVWIAAALVSCVMLFTQHDAIAGMYVFYILGGAGLLTFMSFVTD